MGRISSMAGAALVAGLIITAPSADAQISLAFGFGDPRLEVNAVSATQFEVIEARGAGAQDIWCAAAQFAQDRLGIAGSERLYIDSPRGASVTRSGRKGVVFTTQGTGQGSAAVSVSVRRAGDSLPVHHARQFCRNYIIEPEDL